MNLLVTGGCGFIGSNFIRQRLAEKGSPLRKLVNLDKLTYAGNPANLAEVAADARYVFVRGDIGDRAVMDALLREHRIEAVVHLAAESHVDRSIDSPEPFIETNTVGTLRVLEATLKYWRGLEEKEKNRFRLLYLSTDEVYGDIGAGPPSTEQSPFTPNSPYAASKAAADHLVRAYARTYKLPTLTIRSSNNYGPFQFPEKLIPLVLLNALEGKPLPVYGDGQQSRDWIYVEDHCAAIWQVLQRGQPGGVYNVGGASEQTNLEVVRRICGILDQQVPQPGGQGYARQITFVADRPGHDRRYATNCAKLQGELGWQPKELFATGLEQTVKWYLAHRAWCGEITAKKYARERLGSSTPAS
jgi:dTDP-glucose 4,6-dehydratase